MTGTLLCIQTPKYSRHPGRYTDVNMLVTWWLWNGGQHEQTSQKTTITAQLLTHWGLGIHICMWIGSSWCLFNAKLLFESMTNCRLHHWGQILIKLINSLAPGKFEWNFIHVTFKRILVIDGWGISCEIAVMWMDFIDYQSTLVQVMAWCSQATSHYLSQCWPRSLSPYGVTRPQWVNWINEDFLFCQ